MFALAKEAMRSLWSRCAPQAWVQGEGGWKGPEQLSFGNLKKVQDRLESQGLLNPELRRCFELALEEFPREPPCVQNNARLVMEPQGQGLAFLSEEPWCEITVSHSNGEPHYHVQELTGDVYLARLHSRPQLLSTTALQRVRGALEKWGLMDEELGACFERALEGFPREPPCVRRNARMTIRHDNIKPVFVSGEGECEITVSEGDREPCYEVKEPTVMVYRERLRTCPQRLSLENLERIRDRLESWEVMTEALRCAFDLVLREFPKEPECIRDNPRMCVVWDETKLQLISEDGDCEVSVTCWDEKPSYEVKVKSWATYQERLRLPEQAHSMENLAGVRREVRGLSGTPEKVKGALNVAFRDFSAEPGCLKKNARLIIECDGSELAFVSGKGENRVDVCILDGKITYSVTDTNWQVFLTKLFCTLPKDLVNFLFDQVLSQILGKVLGQVLINVLSRLILWK